MKIYFTFNDVNTTTPNITFLESGFFEHLVIHSISHRKFIFLTIHFGRGKMFWLWVFLARPRPPSIYLIPAFCLSGKSTYTFFLLFTRLKVFLEIKSSGKARPRDFLFPIIPFPDTT